MDRYKAAALTVLAAVREYLPPDGISKDELISRVIEAVDNPEFNEGVHKARVRVRPLEWAEQEGRDSEYPRWNAEAIGTRYSVFKAWWGTQNKWGFVSCDGFHDTAEEAKAAAQADYERRILSAIET